MCARHYITFVIADHNVVQEGRALSLIHTIQYILPCSRSVHALFRKVPARRTCLTPPTIPAIQLDNYTFATASAVLTRFRHRKDLLDLVRITSLQFDHAITNYEVDSLSTRAPGKRMSIHTHVGGLAVRDTCAGIRLALCARDLYEYRCHLPTEHNRSGVQRLDCRPRRRIGAQSGCAEAE